MEINRNHACLCDSLPAGATCTLVGYPARYPSAGHPSGAESDLAAPRRRFEVELPGGKLTKQKPPAFSSVPTRPPTPPDTMNGNGRVAVAPPSRLTRRPRGATRSLPPGRSIPSAGKKAPLSALRGALRVTAVPASSLPGLGAAGPRGRLQLPAGGKGPRKARLPRSALPCPGPAHSALTSPRRPSPARQD